MKLLPRRNLKLSLHEEEIRPEEWKSYPPILLLMVGASESDQEMTRELKEH